jgi:hypothetical protein
LEEPPNKPTPIDQGKVLTTKIKAQTGIPTKTNKLSQESKLALVNNFNGFIVWVVSSPTELLRSRDLAQVKDGHLLPSVHVLLNDVGF